MIVASHILKLERACEHLDSLNSESRAWINTKPYGIVDEPDPEPPLHQLPNGFQARRFRITKVPDAIPGRFSIIVGDCLFNLRSCLDHLALALSLRNTPGLTDRQQRDPMFPIYMSAVDFGRLATKRVCYMSAAARAAIQSLQPYQAGNSASSHPLWQISELNNVDKHRRLTAITSEPSHTDSVGNRMKCVAIAVDGSENWAEILYAYSAVTELKLDGVFMRWAGLPKDINREMHLNPEVSVEIVFDQGGVAAFEPVVPCLQALCDFVRNVVVPQLTKFL